ncbi:hypothetical protein L2E82_15893 [Cichorium intybus]|uniref:Uncharacterized protein n=1 Tax=Cichorium intybus TaxID=13427 RepID=A0ACB9F411_CICIN|nr:hypothetical protein L2E82_15893 [Cichorium intybus]
MQFNNCVPLNAFINGRCPSGVSSFSSHMNSSGVKSIGHLHTLFQELLAPLSRRRSSPPSFFRRSRILAATDNPTLISSVSDPSFSLHAHR